MDGGARPLKPHMMRALLVGLGVAGLLAALVAAALLGLLAAGGEGAVAWDQVGRIVATGFLQAGLSTLLALGFGALLALALARRSHFAGRDVLLTAMLLCAVLPAIVAVFGLVALFGRSGAAGALLGVVGLHPGGWLYGWPGILIGHVFFNAPLSARVFLATLEAVPTEQWRLASHLGMGPVAVFRLIDRPALLRPLPGLAGLIFLLCFTSFAIVLTLGGGPRLATLEVAIYEAVRFEADFARAAVLGLVQIAICLPVALIVARIGPREDDTAGLGRAIARPDSGVPALKGLDALVIAAAIVLLLGPLVAVAVSGVRALPSLLDADVGAALLSSLSVALLGGLGALGLAFALAFGQRAAKARRPGLAPLFDATALAALALPPIALSAGLFVVLRDVADPFALALPLVALMNALMALPFVLRQIAPPLMTSAARFGRLADSLGVAGLARFRLVDLPLVKAPALTAFAFAAALSFGDLGAAAFFGSGDFVTLPVLLARALGAYRTADAAAIALLIAGLELVLFGLAARFGRSRHAGS